VGRAANQLAAVDPVLVSQGTTGPLASFTLDMDERPALPPGVTPETVMIGSIAGTSATHHAIRHYGGVRFPGMAVDCRLPFPFPFLVARGLAGPCHRPISTDREEGDD